MGFIDFPIYVKGRAREALQKAINERGLRSESVRSLKFCWELIIGRISERFMRVYEEYAEMTRVLQKVDRNISYNRYGHCVTYCNAEAKRIIRQMFGRAWT
jgi:hypothetical protein